MVRSLSFGAWVLLVLMTATPAQAGSPLSVQTRLAPLPPPVSEDRDLIIPPPVDRLPSSNWVEEQMNQIDQAMDQLWKE